jgi:hypothetical protein
MFHRSVSKRLARVAFLVSTVGLGLGLGVATMGCSNAPSKKVAAAGNLTGAPATNELSAVAAGAAPVGEQRLDTSTPAAPTPANRIANTNAPLTTSFRAAKARKPGSDENLPNWVPLRGRLTVVEAPDLAENLGLVPKGTTKSSEERVSVADLMAKNSATASTGNATSGTSATWLASNGRVRHSRGR